MHGYGWIVLDFLRDRELMGPAKISADVYIYV